MTVLTELVTLVASELQKIPQPVRAYIYRVATATAALLVVLGVIVEGEAQEWLNLAAALLGVPTQALAAANTPKR